MATPKKMEARPAGRMRRKDLSSAVDSYAYGLCVRAHRRGLMKSHKLIRAALLREVIAFIIERTGRLKETFGYEIRFYQTPQQSIVLR